MNKIIRIWNQNRRKIIIIALVVVFFFIILQALNQMAKNNIEKNNAKQENTEKENLPTQSIITGEVVKEETTKINVDVIGTFVEACNSGNTQEAYSLLTDECKNALFPTVEDFINNYYNIIFTEKRTIKIENYKNSSTTNTYLVTFYKDILSTGEVEQANQYKDYITVENKTDKLNINSFISSEEINKETNIEGIKVTVLKQEIYKDYEIYKLEVENNTKNKVILDTRKTSKSIYIVDSESIKYTAFASELANSTFELPQYTSKIFEIKFNKKYNSADRTKKIVFTDIIQNYEQYIQNNTEERLKIEVNF